MCNWSVKRVSFTRSYILLNLVDLVDEISIIASAITSMQPPFVKN